MSILLGIRFGDATHIARRADGGIELAASALTNPIAIETDLLFPGTFTGYARDLVENFLVTPSGGTANRYQFSTDDGTTFLYWNGAAWTISDNTYTQANPVSALTNIVMAQLDNPRGSLVVRMFLKVNGTRPVMSPIPFNFEFDAAFPCPSMLPHGQPKDPFGADLVSSYDSGIEKRRQKRAVERYEYSVQWENLSDEDVDDLREWYAAKRIRVPWNFYDPSRQVIVSVRFQEQGPLEWGGSGPTPGYWSASGNLVQVL